MAAENKLPRTMKAVVIKGPYKVAVEDRPVPKIVEESDVVVKVSMSAPSLALSAGLLGLLLVHSVQLPHLVGLIIRQLVDLETQLGSVEQLQELGQLEPERSQEQDLLSTTGNEHLPCLEFDAKEGHLIRLV